MNKIYYKSPIFVQHLLTSLYGYKLKKERYNKIYDEYFKNYIKEDYNNIDLINNLLHHLKENISFYSNINIDNQNIIGSLKDLPITEKDDLRTELKKRSITSKNLKITKTGGTTGKSLKVYTSEVDRAKRMAYLDYIKYLNNVQPFSKRASFTGKEITPNKHKNKLWRYNFPMNQILYASFKLNIDNVRYVYENMRKNKIESIDGFPTSIHLVAKYILKNKIKIDWNVKAVFPTAETLTENAKSDIERAFNTVVIDQYASSEGAPFIFSNQNGVYNVGHETGFFEFIKIEENIYEMLVTSYINYATPIVRYKIGDCVLINSSKTNLNSIEDDIEILKILGRNSDYLIGDDKNIITSVNLANVIKDLGDKIIQSQFNQKDNGHFEIRLVVSSEYLAQKDERTLINKLNHRLGEKSKYNFVYMDEIPKETSGKTRFIINELLKQ